MWEGRERDENQGDRGRTVGGVRNPKPLQHSTPGGKWFGVKGVDSSRERVYPTYPPLVRGASGPTIYLTGDVGGRTTPVVRT